VIKRNTTYIEHSTHPDPSGHAFVERSGDLAGFERVNRGQIAPQSSGQQQVLGRRHFCSTFVRGELLIGWFRSYFVEAPGHDIACSFQCCLQSDNHARIEAPFGQSLV
jgi:hypothetical protein